MGAFEKDLYGKKAEAECASSIASLQVRGIKGETEKLSHSTYKSSSWLTHLLNSITSHVLKSITSHVSIMIELPQGSRISMGPLLLLLLFKVDELKKKQGSVHTILLWSSLVDIMRWTTGSAQLVVKYGFNVLHNFPRHISWPLGLKQPLTTSFYKRAQRHTYLHESVITSLHYIKNWTTV